MASVDESALASGTLTPISQLRPDLPNAASCVVRGEITITWPYSSVTRTFAFLVADRDVRLRRAKGQVRIELRGPSAKRAAEAGIGGGDEILFSLDGAHFAQDGTSARPPGSRVDWQLGFTEKLILQVKLGESGETKLITVDQPDVEDEAQTDTHQRAVTPEPQEEPAQLAPAATPLYPVANRIGELAPNEFHSPAFLKRDRLAYGSLYTDDIFEEDGGIKGKGRKRSRNDRFSGAWRYVSRSPSLEREPSETEQPDDAEIKEVRDTDAPGMLPTPTKNTETTDHGCQTMDLDMELSAPTTSALALVPSSHSEQRAERSTSVKVSNPPPNPEADKAEENTRPAAQPVPASRTLFGTYSTNSGEYSTPRFAAATAAQGTSGLSIADSVRFTISHEPQPSPYPVSTAPFSRASPVPVPAPAPAFSQPDAYPDSFLDEQAPISCSDLSQHSAGLEHHQPPEYNGGYMGSREPEPVHQGPWTMQTQSAYPDPSSSVNLGFGVSTESDPPGEFSQEIDGLPREGFASFGSHIIPARPEVSGVLEASSDVVGQDVTVIEDDNSEEDDGELQDDYDPRAYNVHQSDDEGLSEEQDEILQEDRDRYGDQEIFEDEENGSEGYESAAGVEPYPDTEEEEEEEGEGEDHYQQPQAPQPVPKVSEVISLLSDSDESDDDGPPPVQNNIDPSQHADNAIGVMGLGGTQAAVQNGTVDFAAQQTSDSLTGEGEGDEADAYSDEDEPEESLGHDSDLEGSIDDEQDQGFILGEPSQSNIEHENQPDDFEDDEDGDGEEDDVPQDGSGRSLDEVEEEEEDLQSDEDQMDEEPEENDLVDSPAAPQEPEVIVIDDSSDDEELEIGVPVKAEEPSGNATDETAKDVEMARSESPVNDDEHSLQVNDQNALTEKAEDVLASQQAVTEVRDIEDVEMSDVYKDTSDVTQVEKDAGQEPDRVENLDKIQEAVDAVSSQMPGRTESTVVEDNTVADSQISSDPAPGPGPLNAAYEAERPQALDGSHIVRPELPGDIVSATSSSALNVVKESTTESPPASQHTKFVSQVPEQELAASAPTDLVQDDKPEGEQLPTPFQTQPSFVMEDMVEAEMVETKAVEVEMIHVDVADAQVLETQVVETQVFETKVVHEKVVHDEIVKTEVLQSEVVQAEVVETEVVEAEAIDADVMETQFGQAKVVGVGVDEPERIDVEKSTEETPQSQAEPTSLPLPPEHMEIDSQSHSGEETAVMEEPSGPDAETIDLIAELLSDRDVVPESVNMEMSQEADQDNEGNIALDRTTEVPKAEAINTERPLKVVNDEVEVVDKVRTPSALVPGASQTPAHKPAGHINLEVDSDLSEADDDDDDDDDELELVSPEPLVDQPVQTAETGLASMTETETRAQEVESTPSPSAQLWEAMEESRTQKVSQDVTEPRAHPGSRVGEDDEGEEEDQSRPESRHTTASSTTSFEPRRLRSSARIAAAESSQEKTAPSDSFTDTKHRPSKRATASPPGDMVREEITVQPGATKTRSKALKALPSKMQNGKSAPGATSADISLSPAHQSIAAKLANGKAASRATSPDLSVPLARQSIAAKQRKTAPEPVRTSPRATRGRLSSEQPNTHHELDSSIQLAKAALASPTKASVASTEGDNASNASTLGTELTKRLRAELHECVNLKSLRYHLDKQLNFVGIVTMEPNPPVRAKGGPREYVLSFFITDPAAAPTQVIEVLMYRPHKESLPTVKPGDAVLLEHFKVRSLAKKGYGLQSHADSAWAVFDSTSSEDAGLPSIKGPPVEDWQDYADYIRQLKEWWASLDDAARQKIEKANKKLDEVNHPK